MYHVRLWVYDQILASGVSGPIDVFTAANEIWVRQSGRERPVDGPFRWRVESLDGKPVRTASGQIVHVDGAINARTAADAVILTAPFVADPARFLDERQNALRPLLSGLRRQHQRGALLGTYCNGSFLLAAAGLLDGRVATTHWAKARDFERRYPRVHLRSAEVMTEQDRILCCGAVTAYLNLALRLVEKLAGLDLAAATARVMLIDANRPSQAPYATLDLQDPQEHSDQLVTRAQQWMQKNFRRSFRVADLARELGASERTLNRRFNEAVGQPPLRHVQALRVALAKRLLETRRLSFEAVSERVGYGDVSTFRQLFKRETGLSPRDYQRQFARPRVATRSGAPTREGART
jgi:transcriptional regulator GlxA family with amidase domain